ncbi:MAG: hypothetical protein PHQ27_04585, partial [Victivallales bacterium]|nr:hypothetical protein [Victivallales bacterium]
LLTGCVWKGGDRMLYPLKPAEDMTPYRRFVGTWEGRIDKKTTAMVQLRYLAKHQMFHLDLTIFEDMETVFPSLIGTFSEIDDATYLCAMLDVNALERDVKAAMGQRYSISHLVIPPVLLARIEPQPDDTIKISVLYFARRDDKGVFKSKIDAAMIYDDRAYLLLNSPDQIREFIHKQKYVLQELMTLRRKSPGPVKPASVVIEGVRNDPRYSIH